MKRKLARATQRRRDKANRRNRMLRRQKKRLLNPVLARISTERGLATRIGEALGITREAVWNWKTVPPLRVLMLESMLDIPRHLIRPDIYPPPRRRVPNGESRRQQEHV